MTEICEICGKEGKLGIPHDGKYHWYCTDSLCWAIGKGHEANYRARIKAERKAQLAALPRCEVPGCTRRGALKVAHCMLMCKAHYQAANSKAQSWGIFGGLLNPSRETLISMVTGGTT